MPRGSDPRGTLLVSSQTSLPFRIRSEAPDIDDDVDPDSEPTLRMLKQLQALGFMQKALALQEAVTLVSFSAVTQASIRGQRALAPLEGPIVVL